MKLAPDVGPSWSGQQKLFPWTLFFLLLPLSLVMQDSFAHHLISTDSADYFCLGVLSTLTHYLAGFFRPPFHKD